MTLYTSIASNIRKTWLLFAIFLIVIIALGWFFSYYFDSQVILFWAVGISVVMSFISYWYSDKIILFISRAKPLDKKNCPGLYQMVRNLCKTAGLLMPKIYIIDEQAPNAFATGRNQKHAAIAITRGLLETLDRSELEGVISHELSHIGNRDILIQTVIVVLIGSIVMLSDFFLRWSLWGKQGKQDSQERGDLQPIIMFIGVILSILSPLIAKLIQLAISRKREFLADASGALLTQHPEGLARALAKISKNQTPLKIANKATAHLFLASPFKGEQNKNWLVRLFSTHPPVEERIKRLREITYDLSKL